MELWLLKNVDKERKNKATNIFSLPSESEELSTLYQLFIYIKIIRKMRLNYLSQSRSTLASFFLDKGRI